MIRCLSGTRQDHFNSLVNPEPGICYFFRILAKELVSFQAGWEYQRSQSEISVYLKPVTPFDILRTRFFPISPLTNVPHPFSA